MAVRIPKVYDLHVSIPAEGDWRTAAELLTLLRVKGIGLPLDSAEIPPLKNAQIDVVRRLNLMPRSTKELKKSLAKLRRRYELISVYPLSQQLLAASIKDSRIDLLSAVALLDLEVRASHLAEAARHEIRLEVEVASILRAEGEERIKLLAELSRLIKLALISGMPIVVSSGAKNPFELCGYNSLAALAWLAGIPAEHIKECIYKEPRRLVEINRRKLLQPPLPKGVELVK